MILRCRWVALFFFRLAWAAGVARSEPHNFDARDLVMMDRVSDPQLSPDGKQLAFQLRETNFAENKGVNGIWLIDMVGRNATPRRLTPAGADATSPRWAPDGSALYYLAESGGSTQVRRREIAGVADAPPSPGELVTRAPGDVSSYKVAPDGKSLLLAIDAAPQCPSADPLECPKPQSSRTPKATGALYDKLFVRHWDAWVDDKRSRLFINELGKTSGVARPARRITSAIDGDVPSKPFGDDSEFAYSPDAKTIYFAVRIAGTTEAWSTNFDIYSVPADGSAAPRNLTASNPAWDGYPLPAPDGKTLYYLAMKRPGFEADRFSMMALDLATGRSREIDPGWDRSAGPMQLSKDGRTLYTTTDDNGEHPLFAVDVRSGKVAKVTGAGQVEGFNVARDTLVVALSTLEHPADLFRIGTHGGSALPITHLNAERLANSRMAEHEFFNFRGAGNDTVQGFVVKPVDYVRGRKYPVAFLIHGGPQWALRNEFDYRWNPQVYAGQGFAVVTINYHGSTGYGQAFTDSISGDWGGRPLEDLKKGWMTALEKYAFLDGSRACALGPSYGGYMVYWMAGNWNQPWQCLVDHDGIFDSRMMGYSTEELWFEEWENNGTPFDRPENYEKFNPVNYVSQWRVPMLVIHSERDYRIPVDQGIGAFTALQRRGIPSEFLTFPDENHWVLKPQNSLLWHDTVIAWLRRWTAAAPQ